MAYTVLRLISLGVPNKLMKIILFYFTTIHNNKLIKLNDKIKQNSRCVCETLSMPPVATKSKKAILEQSQSQGHKVIDLGVI